jgi:hypothetical protein
MTGYLHPDYARSLAAFGKPRVLPGSGAPVLIRSIPETDRADALGVYPLVCCRDWSSLGADLAALAQDCVSLALVVDPFSGLGETELRGCFDQVKLFKQHFVAELGPPVEVLANKHHRYYSRQAFKTVGVQTVDRPADHLDAWGDLYDHLIRRHELRGIKAFNREAFAIQLSIPGMVMLRADDAQGPVGMHLWYVQGEVAYSHLAAFNDRGYDAMAAYALYWHAITWFTGKVKYLNIGSGAGVSTDATDGLTRFKRGWANASRPVWFCGRVFDREVYDRLSSERAPAGTAYFPAYRAGEF